MLPGLLSADLCSLRAGVDRLCVSVTWRCTRGPGKGEGGGGSEDELTVDPSSMWFGRTVIRSAHSLAYQQAQRLIEGSPPDVPGREGEHARSRRRPLPQLLLQQQREQQRPTHLSTGAAVPERLYEPLRCALRVLASLARSQK